MMVKTLGQASHLNLADASTSPPFRNTSKPPTPINEIVKNYNSSRPRVAKELSNPGLNNIVKPLEATQFKA